MQRRLEEDPDFRSTLEFWESMANKARHGQDPIFENGRTARGQAKSSTGQFFEEVSQRSQNLGQRWKDRQAEGYVETPKSESVSFST